MRILTVSNSLRGRDKTPSLDLYKNFRSKKEY
nr:MAG TPA: hypothetical protein [Caudoviricetes sp.]